MSIEDIGVYAFEGQLKLSTVVTGVVIESGFVEPDPETGHHFIPQDITRYHGLLRLEATNVFALFKGVASVDIRSFDSDELFGYIHLAKNEEPLELTLNDVVIEARERRDFERQWSVNRSNRVIGPGPGKPAKYKWDEMFVDLLFHVDDKGWPPRLSDLIHLAEDIFISKTGHSPEESTLRKKLRPIFKRAEYEGRLPD